MVYAIYQLAAKISNGGVLGTNKLFIKLAESGCNSLRH